jgi:hypothetical protein
MITRGVRQIKVNWGTLKVPPSVNQGVLHLEGVGRRAPDVRLVLHRIVFTPRNLHSANQIAARAESSINNLVFRFSCRHDVLRRTLQ